MNYKLLILLLFIFSVYSLLSIKKISGTAYEAPEKIKVHVLVFDANVSIFLNDSTCESFTKGYCIGDVVNVTNKLVNVGNANITGSLLTRIFNRANEIHSKAWEDVKVLEGETEYYNTTYKLQDKDVDYSSTGPEIFTAMSNYSFDEKFNDTTCIFKVKKSIGTFHRSPDITKTIPPGRSEIYPAEIQLWLDDACNSTTVTLNVTQGIPGEWVSFSQDNLYLNTPIFWNSTDVNITIPPLIKEGVYDNGTIYLFSDDPHASNPVGKIKLNITVAMLDFILRVKTQEKSVCQGKIVPASINITKILPPEDVNVSITYQIIDYNHTVYDEKRDYMTISNKSVQKLYTLTAPSSVNESYYIFLVTLDYNSTLTQAYDTFKVIPCPTIPTTGGGGAGEGIGAPAPAEVTVRAISLNLSADMLTVIIGNRTSFIALVRNIGVETVESIKISIEGIPSEWVRVFPTTTNLDIGEVEEYLVIINIPTNATPGVYRLKVKATDDVESNTVILTLIIGRDPKEVAELLLKELESIRSEVKRSLLIDDCIDITIIKTFYKDAEMAFENGMKEYENKNYEGAINWFEYALPIEKKVVDKVDITLELEVETTNSSKFLIPPFYKSTDQFQLAGTYLKEKNYEKICDPLEKIKKFILVGLIFWPGIFILFIILIISIIILLKRRKQQERVKILERIKERLRTSNA